MLTIYFLQSVQLLILLIPLLGIGESGQVGAILSVVFALERYFCSVTHLRVKFGGF